MISTLLLTGFLCVSAGKSGAPTIRSLTKESAALVSHVAENYSLYDERFEPLSVFKQFLFERETALGLVTKEDAECFRKALESDETFKYVEGLENHYAKDKSAIEKTMDMSKEFLCTLMSCDEMQKGVDETKFFNEDEETKPADDVYDMGDGIILPKYSFDETMIGIRANGKTASGQLIGFQANRDACVALYDTINSAKGYLSTGVPGLYGTLFSAIAGLMAGIGLSSLISTAVAKIGSSFYLLWTIIKSSVIGIIIGVIVVLTVAAVLGMLIGMYVCGSQNSGFIFGWIVDGWSWKFVCELTY